MTRNVFYRDFTICKAVALVGLIAAAWALGGLRNGSGSVADAEDMDARVLPVVYTVFDTECDKTEVGVEL